MIFKQRCGVSSSGLAQTDLLFKYTVPLKKKLMCSSKNPVLVSLNLYPQIEIIWWYLSWNKMYVLTICSQRKIFVCMVFLVWRKRTKDKIMLINFSLLLMSHMNIPFIWPFILLWICYCPTVPKPLGVFQHQSWT